MRLPFWFRAVVFALFAILLVPYFLLRNGAQREALARTLAGSVIRDLAPVLQTQAVLPGGMVEPADGAYSVNGMRVEYHTYPNRLGVKETFRRFEAAFDRVGYLHRIVPVQGATTLVAIHPETKMLLTVRPGRDPEGNPMLRLAEQNLSELDPSFRAEIEGVPEYPGAKHLMLVSSERGSLSRSLTFTTDDPAAAVARYYARAMRTSGWAPLESPRMLPQPGLEPLFFQKRQAECSVLAIPSAESGETFVMVTMTATDSSAS